MKKGLIITLTLALLFSLSACDKKPPLPYAKINGRIIKLELADTPELIVKGLSGRATLAEDRGMLFIFPGKKTENFWMKEMNFPLDIIWINDDLIVKIDANLSPEGIKPINIYSSNSPVNYVLEVNADWSRRHDVKVGDKIELFL